MFTGDTIPQERHENILGAIGNTPLVAIQRLNPNKRVKIFAKLEGCNPGGSVKDRVALYMIDRAEKRGELRKGQIILEATSGNTGIGLALVAAAKGYRLCLTMPESASEERKKILRAMGAELHITPANLGTDGAIEVAYSMLRENPEKYFGTDQFNNRDNILAHYEGTGEEIWCQTAGAVTMVVVALGTTGTAMGISARLKEYNPSVKIIGVEPYLEHKIQGLKNMKESYRPGIFDKNMLDEKVNIRDEDAFEMARKLAREEGILAGMSSGAAMYVACEKAKDLDGGVVVVILPDGGERYLSTDLYADKPESPIRFYNTLTREKEPFHSINPDKVLMHSCGPTVHDVPHLGSYRRFVISDLIRRYLEYKGYQVNHVMNIIDLADRSVRGAERAGVALDEYLESYASTFFRDLAKLNIRQDERYPRASENVEAMLKLVETLAVKGYAYEKLRSVYFDISKFDEYGRLSNIDLVKVQRGRTVDRDDYEKDNPVDFTLLKRSTLGELKRGLYFKTRWGNVRPSWHLECAAISLAYLGDTFDIHTSGMDILFPHCENVRAIGKAATGKPMATYWLNTELVMVEGKKMSRSLGNALVMEDLESRGYRGRDIRFFLLSAHYRKPLHFSFGALETARNTVRKLDGFIQRLIRFTPGSGYADTARFIEEVQEGFNTAMDDDLNISGALAALFNFVKKIGMALGKLSETERDDVLSFIQGVDAVLGIMNFAPETIDDDALRLIEERRILRQKAQWSRADEIRKQLSERGIEILDTPGGSTWKRR